MKTYSKTCSEKLKNMIKKIIIEIESNYLKMINKVQGKLRNKW